MRRLQIWQVFGLLALFNAYPVMAQGPDDEGPAPPPPAAPINEWLPFMFVVGVVLVYFILHKQRNLIIFKTK